MRSIRAIFPVLILLAAIPSCKSTQVPVADTAAQPVENTVETVVPRTVTITTWKLTLSRTAYPDGVVSAVSSMNYDDNGTLVLEESFDGKNNLVSKKTYSRQNAATEEIVVFNPAGETLGKSVRGYDGALLVRETLYNPKGEIQSTEEYRYDEAGNKTGMTVKTATGGMVSTEYAYENGTLVRISVLDASGNTIKRFERSYSADGSLEKESEFDGEGNIRGTIQYFYANGFLAREENRNATGSVLSRLEYVNDTEGNPVEVRYLDRNGRLLEVTTRQWKSFTRTITEQ